MNNSGNWTGFFTYAKTTGGRNSFKVDIKFKVDGANKILVGKGHDASGAFELIDSLVTGDIVRFRKKYLNQENDDVLIKYAGRLKGNAQIEGKWWIPGEKKIHGFSSCVMRPMRYVQDQNLNFSAILVCFSIPLFSPLSEVNHQAKVANFQCNRNRNKRTRHPLFRNLVFLFL